VNNINITFVTDSNYLLYTLCALESVLENTDSVIDCQILTNSQINDKLTRKIEEYKELNPKLNLKIFEIDNSFIDNVITKSYVSNAAYIKILIPEILADISKTIYLDSDLILNNDIELLWRLGFSHEFPIAASEDPAYIYDHQIIGLQRNEVAFNSGVMCLNLDLMRKLSSKDKLIRFIKEKNHLTVLNDQPAFNSVFINNWKCLPKEWNFLDTYFFERDNAIYASRKSIIHFSGPAKPWKYRCAHPYKKQYLNYYGKISSTQNLFKDKSFIDTLKKLRDGLLLTRYYIFEMRYRDRNE